MYKLCFLLLSIIFLACNNSGTPATTAPDSSKPVAAPTVAGNWTKEDEMEFMDNCVSGAKGTIGEQKAYTKCKCMFTQVQAKYASLDSSVIEKLKDTAEVMKMAKNCE